MGIAERASSPASTIDARAAIDAIPRIYNFAADVIERNLKAGRADKVAYIDPRGTWTYGKLAERVDRFGAVLRSLGVRREERILLALLDTIDWPTAFFGAVKTGVVPIPVNTLMTEDDYRFMLADSRARVLVVSEELFAKFANLIDASPGPRACDRLGREPARPSPLRGSDRRRTGGVRTPRRPSATTCASGSIRPARPAGPRAQCTPTPICQLTADLYADGVLGLKETDVCYSVAKLFFAYGLGNAMTFPLWPAPHGAVAGAADAGWRRQDSARASGDGVLCGADVLCGVSREPRCTSAFRAQAEAAAFPPARRCRRRLGSVGKIVTASIFSTASARRKCCTSSFPIIRAT